MKKQLTKDGKWMTPEEYDLLPEEEKRSVFGMVMELIFGKRDSEQEFDGIADLLEEK